MIQEPHFLFAIIISFQLSATSRHIKPIKTE